MWIANTTINKPPPDFLTNLSLLSDFSDKTEYLNINITNSNITDNKFIYKLVFNYPNKLNFNNLDISTSLHSITNSVNSNNFNESSIDSLTLEDNYIQLFKLYDYTYLDDIYLFTNSTGVLDLNIEYKITNITKYADIYNFINSSFNVKKLTFKDNEYNQAYDIEPSFLQNINFSENNTLSIIYTFNINLQYSKFLVADAICSNTKYNIKWVSHSNLNYNYIDKLTRYNKTYINAITLENIKSETFISNKNYFILID